MKSKKPKAAAKKVTDSSEEPSGLSFDFWIDEQNRIHRMSLGDVRRIQKSLGTSLSDLLEIDRRHGDIKARMEAGRILADLCDRLEKAKPRLKKESAGFKARWSKELHVKGRMPPTDGMQKCSRRIWKIHYDAQGYLLEKVRNLLSHASDQCPLIIDEPQDNAGFQGFLLKLRNWSALRAGMAKMEREARRPVASPFAQALAGKPMVIPPKWTDTKSNIVDGLAIEIKREIAGERFDEYWREVMKPRAQAVWKEYRDRLQPAQRSKTPYPAHALRPLKEALLASMQRTL